MKQLTILLAAIISLSSCSDNHKRDNNSKQQHSYRETVLAKQEDTIKIKKKRR